jgi:hypothetical protein
LAVPGGLLAVHVAVGGPDVVQHRLDQVILQPDLLRRVAQAVVDGERLTDGPLGRGPVEIVDVQVVDVDIRDASL